MPMSRRPAKRPESAIREDLRQQLEGIVKSFEQRLAADRITLEDDVEDLERIYFRSKAA